MNRTAGILTQLETTLSASGNDLANHFGVAAKTIQSDIEQLNELLAPAAMIRTQNGTYRLVVVDVAGFKALKEKLLADQGNFNDPDFRLSHILSRLARSDAPIRTVELAIDMSVARNTVVTDIARLRRLLAGYSVTVEGRTNVGLTLTGPELGVRLAILKHAQFAAWENLPQVGAINVAMAAAFADHRVPPDLVATMGRWATIIVDRRQLGHPLSGLPGRYNSLRGTPAHQMAARIAARLQTVTDPPLPEAEILFLAIPLAGRRTPLSLDDLGGLVLSAHTRELVGRIFARIWSTMDIRLTPPTLMEQFSTHIAFAINRMRYGLPLADETVTHQVRGEYPVAYRMATIARDQIYDETGLMMEEAEVCLVTTYFQVFLEEYVGANQSRFRVAIATNRGPAVARLIRSQLAKIMPGTTHYVALAPDATEADLAENDLIVATPGLNLASPTPVLELVEVFDHAELARQLDRLRLPHLRQTVPGVSLLCSLLDEDRIVRLSPRASYWDCVIALANHLRHQGLVDEAFQRALSIRESERSSRFDERIGFPRAIAPNDRGLIAALGLLPRSDVESSLKIVILLAIPASSPGEASTLIRAYDEIIRLSANPALVNEIAQLSTYERLLALLESATRG
ncbi:MAG: PRD domain-containing protein [Propionibacteriaceae bacterium]|jgi:lichenan operon transcriptional antiterminator|nr:PRD domain-containing protein [Propionibacteriaceae bacterium]